MLDDGNLLGECSLLRNDVKHERLNVTRCRSSILDDLSGLFDRYDAHQAKLVANLLDSCASLHLLTVQGELDVVERGQWPDADWARIRLGENARVCSLETSHAHEAVSPQFDVVVVRDCLWVALIRPPLQMLKRLHVEVLPRERLVIKRCRQPLCVHSFLK